MLDTLESESSSDSELLSLSLSLLSSLSTSLLDSEELPAFSLSLSL